MPPAMSDDESDNMDIPDQIPAKRSTKPDPEEEDEDEEDEDEFQVEEIVGHTTKKKKIAYKVKWLGWDNEEDMTWEPLENLANAEEAVARYHTSIGGTPQPQKKGKGGAKRSSSAMDSPAPGSSHKKARGRKSEANGDSWEPPVGSWEDHVTRIAAIVEEETKPGVIKKSNVQSLEGLILWNNGRKTQHKMTLLRQKCPQRLLDYYENHLLKPRLDEMADMESP